MPLMMYFSLPTKIHFLPTKCILCPDLLLIPPPHFPASSSGNYFLHLPALSPSLFPRFFLSFLFLVFLSHPALSSSPFRSHCSSLFRSRLSPVTALGTVRDHALADSDNGPPLTRITASLTRITALADSDNGPALTRIPHLRYGSDLTRTHA